MGSWEKKVPDVQPWKLGCWINFSQAVKHRQELDGPMDHGFFWVMTRKNWKVQQHMSSELNHPIPYWISGPAPWVGISSSRPVGTSTWGAVQHQKHGTPPKWLDFLGKKKRWKPQNHPNIVNGKNNWTTAGFGVTMFGESADGFKDHQFQLWAPGWASSKSPLLPRWNRVSVSPICGVSSGQPCMDLFFAWEGPGINSIIECLN